MNPYYRNYGWKMGKPVGKDPVDSLSITDTEPAYKIVIDPYFKRISIEKYVYGLFDRIVYDSVFLDFRKLNPNEQTAWSREVLTEEDASITNLIRDHQDRLILVETSRFEQGLCCDCRINSVHGVPLSIHRMYYKEMNGPFNGVILYDMEDRPVMFKEYETDPQTGEFTNLIQEDWNMENRGIGWLPSSL